MPDDDTQVRVSERTWRELNALKVEPGESFDDAIRRLLDGDVWVVSRDPPEGGVVVEGVFYREEKAEDVANNVRDLPGVVVWGKHDVI